MKLCVVHVGKVDLRLLGPIWKTPKKAGSSGGYSIGYQVEDIEIERRGKVMVIFAPKDRRNQRVQRYFDFLQSQSGKIVSLKGTTYRNMTAVLNKMINTELGEVISKYIILEFIDDPETVRTSGMVVTRLPIQRFRVSDLIEEVPK